MLKKSIRHVLGAAILVVFFAVPALTVNAFGQEQSPAVQTPVAGDEGSSYVPLLPGQMPYFDIVPDPIEPVNRCVSGFNRGFFYSLIYPFNKGYAFLLPQPVRKSIEKFGHNLAYPIRGLNSCLQGKWHGAWEETKRFGTNTTVGVLGFFDPATQFGIGRSDEDFGQTFGHYGVGPGFYVALPLIGPSNARDAIGTILDYPFDLASQLFGARAFFTLNTMSMHNDELYHVFKHSNDPYLISHVLWSINRENNVQDYVPAADGTADPDPSIGSALFEARTQGFLGRAKTRSVFCAHSGSKVSYSLWLQKNPAPLLVSMPGLGSHRLDSGSLAFCDIFYRNGYSVLAISNVFNREFMETASSSALPGDTTRDRDDVLRVLKAVVDDVRIDYESRFTALLLGGVSYGAHMTLQTAAAVARNEAYGLNFDRYIAVNPPLSLTRGLQQLDRMFNAPLQWPADTREQRMRTTLNKAVALSNGALDPGLEIPLTLEESQFLIGVLFRYVLVNVIQNSQERNNLGILKNDPAAFRRLPLYREIREISFAEYQQRFVLPYVEETFGTSALETMIESESLEFLAPSLQTMRDKIVLQVNADDFLLSEQDLQWYRGLMGPRLIEYSSGGHLGNLRFDSVQNRLIRAANAR
jgi:ABC-type transporter lipoprotein component MlaA